MKKHNFSAGPCILPQDVVQKAAQAVVELDNSGLSLIEISHRSTAFIEIMDKATSLAIETPSPESKITKKAVIVEIKEITPYPELPK